MDKNEETKPPVIKLAGMHRESIREPNPATGHTPGPWVVKHDKQGLPFIGVASDPWTYPGTVATVEQGKDARLIAAAPETLEALKELLDQLEGIGIPEWSGAEGLCLTQARAAIAKAEGGAS